MRVELSIGTIDLLRFVRYDHDFPRHAHDFFTLGVFLRGNGELYCRGARWPAGDGTVLAVPPDEAHEAVPSRGGWTYDVMYPSRELARLVSDDMETVDSPRFERPVFDDPDLAREILGVHRLLRSTDSLAAEERLLSVLRRLIERHATPHASSHPRAIYAVARAREVLTDRYAEHIPLAQLAAACAVSPFHLIRVFRDVVGMPPHAFQTQVRANRARDMLRRGEPSSRVAHECGFADQSHFTRTFKRIFRDHAARVPAGHVARCGY